MNALTQTPDKLAAQEQARDEPALMPPLTLGLEHVELLGEALSELAP